MKVVINRCYGGFGLSKEAVELFLQAKGIDYVIEEDDVISRIGGVPMYRRRDDSFVKLSRSERNKFSREDRIAYTERENDIYLYDVYARPNRNDPDLVRIVEELGAAANGFCAQLEIVEIPDDVNYEIDEYDGMEKVVEPRREWY